MVVLLLVPLVLVGIVMLRAGMHATSATTFTHEPAGGVARQVAFSLLLAVSSGVFLIGLEMRDPLWTSLVTITGGVGLIVALQRVTPPGTLTVRRGVPAGIATRATLSLSFFGIEVFLPLAMTELRGASLTMAGMTLAAGALVWVAGSLVQSHHEKKAGTHTRQGDTATGLVLLTAGIATITPPCSSLTFRSPLPQRVGPSADSEWAWPTTPQQPRPLPRPIQPSPEP